MADGVDQASANERASDAAHSLWDRVEDLVRGATALDALTAHRLHLVAARLLVQDGRPLPGRLRRQQQYTTLIAMATPLILQRVRAACGGRLMVMKGPEVAALYRHPADRGFRDLDILTDDPAAVQRELVVAGFHQLGDPRAYDREQHLCPLVWPGIPVVVELHRRPNTPSWLPPVHGRSVLDRAVPSATGAPGLSGPDASAHALLLAAHSWAHCPLGRLRDIVDVAAVMGAGDWDEVEELAARWRWTGMWNVVGGAARTLLGERPAGRGLRFLSRHLLTVHDRTVIENHLTRAAAPALALPLRDVAPAVMRVLLATGRPSEGESWPNKLRRASLAVAHARSGTAQHESALLRRSMS